MLLFINKHSKRIFPLVDHRVVVLRCEWMRKLFSQLLPCLPPAQKTLWALFLSIPRPGWGEQQVNEMFSALCSNPIHRGGFFFISQSNQFIISKRFLRLPPHRRYLIFIQIRARCEQSFSVIYVEAYFHEATKLNVSPLSPLASWI